MQVCHQYAHSIRRRMCLTPGSPLSSIQFRASGPDPPADVEKKKRMKGTGALRSKHPSPSEESKRSKIVLDDDESDDSESEESQPRRYDTVRRQDAVSNEDPSPSEENMEPIEVPLRRKRRKCARKKMRFDDECEDAQSQEVTGKPRSCERGEPTVVR
eukprot:gnl/Trimastix_PCT/286.p2 GENE.gnl/Trimastix_PCT/286~~gnl/Trimastix_PCT/286.p2  ORF type:complete len:158 (-),score=1.21 gnl/Trimastix_PCT/286:478-951(-)